MYVFLRSKLVLVAAMGELGRGHGTGLPVWLRCFP